MQNQHLASFNPNQAELLGEGGEAQVYALDEAHVVRLFREGTAAEDVAARTTLLAEIAAGATHSPFETPIVLEQGEIFGRIYTLEKRIRGTSLLTALSSATGDVRRRLIEQYMDTAWRIGEIEMERDFFGEIGRKDAIQTSIWQAYLTERASHSLASSPLKQLDANAFSAAIGECSGKPALIHLDYFAGNVMADGDKLTAVIDFGYSSIIGDRRMNALVAAAHLITPRITPTVSAEDQAVAFAWLRERDLFDYYERGLPWLAAFWTFAHDDAELFKWCCSILPSHDTTKRRG